MPSEEPHARLIAQAATEVLTPLGIRRKGRSRIWLDDRAWWLGLIEFKPSSWSKGTGLNVGVMWLWDELPYLAYDISDTVQDFEHYNDPVQFKLVTRRLAERAVQEAAKYRELFASPAAAADYYSSPRVPIPGSLISAGIALGLVGRSGESRECFDAYLAVADDRPWVLENQDRVRKLRVLLDDHQTFLAGVRESIARTRELLGLAALAGPPF